MPNLENAPDPVPFEVIATSTGGEYELTRENTSIFQYLGKLAIYDHIFITPEEINHPLYIWRFEPTTGDETQNFIQVKEKAVEHDSQVLLNLKEISEQDIEVYILHAKTGMGNTLPDWNQDE